MAETTATPAKKAPKPVLTAEERTKKRSLRRKARAAGRKTRAKKIAGDREFAKTLFEARSKRSSDKKSAFRKKKARKK